MAKGSISTVVRRSRARKKFKERERRRKSGQLGSRGFRPDTEQHRAPVFRSRMSDFESLSRSYHGF